jgi:hypothetical protein
MLLFMTTLRQQLDNITTTIKIVCTEGKRNRGVDFETFRFFATNA